MIITLKGASFKSIADGGKGNIGTLTTWSIFTNLGSGATYSGDNSVDRGAAFSGTVTLADGYEVGSAGVSVTMGGTALTEGITIDGSTITIEIAEVTGTVYISVPTKNTATGEEDDGGGSEEGGTDYNDDDLWVSQTVSSSGVVSTTGITQSNIMAKDKFTEGITISVKDSSAYRILIAQVTYNADGSFKARSSWTTLDLATATKSATYSDANPFNVVIATSTNSELSVSEVLNLIDVKAAN